MSDPEYPQATAATSEGDIVREEASEVAEDIEVAAGVPP
jgi:hypothetical protein